MPLPIFLDFDQLKFFDPACGCGNFLILSYKEIRKLEIEALKIIHKENIKNHGMVLDVSTLSIVDVDNFYGIEISEFPSKIAEVAMWLMDHQMNMLLSKEFGRFIERIPLKKAATIKNINALTTDWASVISKNGVSYILGNPPFIGARMKSSEQSKEMASIFSDVKGAMDLDYVSAWYKKASEFIQGTKIKVGFVSTNSITQGTQVGVLWNYLTAKYNIKIHFAHKTFEWDSEASGKAHVHCVIIGFACFDIPIKRLFDYDDIKGEAHEIIVENINPYLINFKDLFIISQSKPICNVPESMFDSSPLDNGHLIFTEDEKNEFLKLEPNSIKYIRPVISSKEYLNNRNRYCLWLKDVSPSELKSMPLVLDRVKKVKEYRLKSKREATKKLALTPYLFGEIRQPSNDYIIIPQVSSERRKYIPIGFMSKNVITSNRCSIVYSDSLYTLGVLMSIMHMTWTKYVCGRLESRYNYSNKIVYNNFPWAKTPNKTQIDNIETKAKHVLDVRAKYPSSSLADLYDPNTMPADLVKAHAELDKAVDSSYGKTTFKNETERIGFLFELYEEYTNPLISGSN